MKVPISRLIFYLMFLLFALAGCGRDSTHSGPPVHFAIRLDLPASLKKSTARYRQLLARASHLEIVFSNDGHIYGTLTYPPQQWDRLPVSAMPLPEELPGGITIEVRVFDRTRDGLRRQSPILVGHDKVSAKTLLRDKVIPISIRLALMESAENPS